MDINENTDDKVKAIAMIEVNSSTKLFSVFFAKCIDVMINRQKPSRFADVAKICCDVLFAMRMVMFIFYFYVINQPHYDINIVYAAHFNQMLRYSI